MSSKKGGKILDTMSAIMRRHYSTSYGKNILRLGVMLNINLITRCFPINYFHIRTFSTIVMNPDINVVKQCNYQSCFLE